MTASKKVTEYLLKSTQEHIAYLRQLLITNPEHKKEIELNLPNFLELEEKYLQKLT
jgi:hypothetical protein